MTRCPFPHWGLPLSLGLVEGLCVSPKASGFCPFGDATGLEESGGRTVVCLIQAAA